MVKKIQVVFSLFVWVFGLYSWLYAAEKPMEPDRAYNQGVDFYNKLDYNKSADSFLQSLNTQNKHLEQWAAYNLGNTFFNQAQAAEQSNPGTANEIYQKALNFFKQSMEIDPTDKAAKYNYELAAKKIIEQKQKAKQEQQDKQDKQDKQEKKDQQDKQNQESKSENQKQKDQQDKQENKENKENKEPDASNTPESKQKQAQQSAGQNEQRGQMTQEEAMMLLENFQKAEDQKKTLDLYKAQQSSGGKDW